MSKGDIFMFSVCLLLGVANAWIFIAGAGDLLNIFSAIVCFGSCAAALISWRGA